MSKSKTAIGLLDRVKGTWGTLQQLLGGRERHSHCRHRRLAPLQELEDRRLLSGTPLIIVDNTSSAATASGGASSLTFSHTVNSGSNSILIVEVAVKHGGASDPVASVAYGGQSLTLVGSGNTPNSMSADIWYLLAPSIGTANVVINLTGSNHFVASATDYFGVSQTTPLGTLATATGTSSSTPSVNVVSASGQLVVDSIVDQGSALAIMPSGSGQTQLWTQATGTAAGDALGAGSYAPGATSVTMTWTENTDQAWALAAVPLLPAPTYSIAVGPTSIQTSMSGASASFSVALTSAPLAPVTISLTSGDPSEGTLSTNTLTFNAGNWNVAQAVTVTGQLDLLAGTNVTYQIMGSASSGDANYNNMSMTPVTVTNVDTNLPGFIVNPTALTTSQSGASASFSVALTTLPLVPVTVNLTNGDPTQGSLSQSSLTFTLLNWDVPQSVTVTGLNDHIANGNQTYQITGTATSLDPTYNNMAIMPVTVTNTQADVAGINVTGSTFLVSEDNSVVRINALTGAVVATYPTGLANDGSTFGPDGTLYVADYYNNQIDHYSAAGNLLGSFGAGQLSEPQGVAFGPDGNLYVTNVNNTVDKFSPTGTFLGTFVSAGSGGLSNAKAIVWGSNGNAYVSSYNNNEVLEYNGTTGAFITVFATGSGGFEDLTFGPDNNLYVAAFGNNTVYRFNGTTGAAMGAFVSGGSLDNPYSLRFDPAGNLDVTSRTSGTIETFSGANGAYLGTLVTGLTNPSFLSTTTSLVTSETGTSATFTVELTSEPVAPVTINLATSVSNEGSLSQPTLTFDASNWNVAQTVTVAGLDDHIVHGDQTYQITGTATSTDVNYNGVSMTPVIVTNTEADVAGLTVTPTSIQTSMAGASASFTVVMKSEPLAPVTISLNSGDPSEGTLSSNALTFDASDWNVGQTVTVTGQNDPLAGSNVTYQITGAASSGDANYNGMAMTAVTVTNVDTTLPGFIVNPTALTTSQSGASASFTVTLTTLPIAPVTVTLTNGDPAQGSLSQSALTFDASDWNTPQTVTVTGLDDHIANGNQTYQITGTANSADSNYNNLAMTPVAVTNTQTDVAGYTVTPASIQTSMAGASASFSVVMTSEPLAPVTISLNSGNPNEGTLSTNTLTFDASDWNVAQTVTVTGQIDPLAGANVTYQITGIASSGDANYNGMVMTAVTVTNVDTTLPGFIVSPTVLQTTNAGASSSFLVDLATQPTSTVTLNLSSTNPAEGSLSSSSLTFDAANWNVAQAVTVTGLNDGLVGNPTYQITGTATSADVNYNGLTMTPVTVTNFNTSAGPVEITSQLGTSATFSVYLGSRPTSPVTVNLTNGNPAQGSLSTNSLNFSVLNWNVPQSVTITGLNDHMVEGNQIYQITGVASSLDPGYNGLTMTPVTVINQGTDVAGIDVTGNSFLVSQDDSVLRIDSHTGPVIATYPTGVLNDGSIFGPDGSLYVADYANNQILHYSATGSPLASFGSSELSTPQGLAFGPNGNLYVTNANGAVDQFSPAGAFLGALIAAGSGGLTNAKAIVWGPDGNAYVTSYFNSEVLQYNGTTGAFMSVFATGSGGFEGLTFGPDGNLYVASYGDNAIYRYSGTTGASLGVFASGPQLINPVGLSFDSAGNLDVASQSSGTIQTYNGTTGAFLGNLDTGLTNPAYLTTTTSLVTSDTGTTASFTVSLTTEPISPVTINLGMTATGQGALSQSSLTFDASDWNVAQTVTVTGLNDFIADGNQTYQITGTVSSADPNYNGLAMTSVSVTNINTNVAGFTGSPTSLVTSDTGTSASFAVALTSQPIAPVTINLGTSVAGQGSLSQSSLTFDASNWNVTQTVTVTGLDNPIFNGNQTYQITGTAISADASYSGLAMTPVAVINTAAAITVTPVSGPITTPGGNGGSGVVLTNNLTSTVTVPLTSSIPTVGLDAAAVLVPGSPLFQTPSGAVSAIPAANSLPSVSAAALAASPHSAVTPNAHGANEALDNGTPTLIAQSVIDSNRTFYVFAPIPRSIWQPVQDLGETALPEELPFPAPPARHMLLTSRQSQMQTVQTDDFLDVLNDDGERIPWTEPGFETTMLVGTGILAGSGYVLLNSRFGLWLLGLLTARPLWKQFDPLDVLYAWEEDDRQRPRDDEDEETLMSLVD